MAGSYVLALDQGTTSSRAIVFDAQGLPVSLAASEFPQFYPRPGWVEHDPEAIWESQIGEARRALADAGVPLTPLPASASPISARRHSSGNAPPAVRLPTPLSGRIGAPRLCAPSCAPRAWRSTCSSTLDW